MYVLLQPVFDLIRKVPSQSTHNSIGGMALSIDQGHAFDISLSALWLTHVSGEEMAYVGPTQSESSILEAFQVAQSLYKPVRKPRLFHVIAGRKHGGC